MVAQNSFVAIKNKLIFSHLLPPCAIPSISFPLNNLISSPLDKHLYYAGAQEMEIDSRTI